MVESNVATSSAASSVLPDKKKGYTFLLTVSVLTLACVVAFSLRLFAVVRFESIIHEFDPWFNYRSTAYMVENGVYNFM